MVQIVTNMMGITSSESAELNVNKLQNVAHTRFKQLKKDRGVDVGLLKLEEFATSFLDRFSIRFKEI